MVIMSKTLRKSISPKIVRKKKEIATAAIYIEKTSGLLYSTLQVSRPGHIHALSPWIKALPMGQ